MQRTPHVCPECQQPLCIHLDMWGPYYLCEDCGWTAEDDDEVTPAAARPQKVARNVLSVAEALRAWEARQRL